MDKRRVTQFLTLILTNANFKGFFEGTIYKGNSKRICVPGMNCYSCPGALGSCPIGALQSVIGSVRYNISLYVIGYISLIGILFGRLICGWVCPFGLIQELIYKISPKKIKLNIKLDNMLKYLKYALLVIFVIILPMFLTNKFGIAKPYFCEYICPVGTLEAGLPLVILNKFIRKSIGFLFAWKLVILVVLMILALYINRPFCRYLCPLGAFYSVFNKISFYKMKIEEDKCIKCGICTKTCEQSIEVYKNPNSLDCIRCKKCIDKCPQKAIEGKYIL